MRKRHPRQRDKPHFVHDENLEFIELRKSCSRVALFTSAIKVMGGIGAKDPNIIKECEKKNLHIITHNRKDFNQIREGFRLGVVWIGLTDVSLWISKFSRMLRVFPKHRNYYYRNIHIKNVVIAKNRVTGEIRIL